MGDFMEFGPKETEETYRRDKNDSLNIIACLDQFFDEDRFSIPAIKDTMHAEGNTQTRDIWWPIWKDKSSFGVFYKVGAESGYGIAYSKKEKKVIIYLHVVKLSKAG